MNDLKYAWRQLVLHPGLSVTIVVMLALGIGANTAIFSLLSAVLLKPLPFAEPDRLVTLWVDFSANGGPARLEPSPAYFVDWKARNKSFDDMAAFETRPYNLTGNGEPERLTAIRTTANLFSLLGLQPVLGRTFLADDEGPSALPAVVISETLWRRRFGGDPGIIGRSITLDGLNRTVIGVVPPDFRFPNAEVSIWVPAAFTPDELARRDSFYLYVVARLKPAVALGSAQAEMTGIAQALNEEIGSRFGPGLGVTVARLHEHLAREAKPTLLVLLGAVGAVLLITCANVANLLLTRGASRRKELALRKALGAGERRVLRQLLTESAVLAGIGISAGAALSTLAYGYLGRLMPGTFPADVAPALDWRVLGFTAATGVLTVLLFGAGPAFAATRFGISEMLRVSAGRGSTARSGRMRHVLVVAEVTLTVVLLIAAGLLLRSYANVLAVDPGFEPRNLLLVETALAPSQYGDAAKRLAFQRDVLDRVRALPGVTSAGYVNIPPLVFKGGRASIAIEGRPAPPAEEFSRFIISDRMASRGYLATLGVPLIHGRQFDDRDAPDAPGAVIVNQALVRLHFPDQDPIGARLKLGGPDGQGPWYTIIGVVGDVHQMGLDVAAEPELYFPFEQAPINAPFFWPNHLVVRTQGEPLALAAAVRNAVWDVDAMQPVANVRTMGEIVNAELTNRNTQLTLVGVFAVLALVLAAIGLYGVLSYSVTQRTAELGLRMALGAQRRNVVGAILRGASLLVALGIALGLAGALGLTRLLASFLFGVTPADPVTLSGVVLIVASVATVAALLPALRASRIDPMQALREE